VKKIDPYVIAVRQPDS